MKTEKTFHAATARKIAVTAAVIGAAVILVVQLARCLISFKSSPEQTKRISNNKNNQNEFRFGMFFIPFGR